MISDEGIMKQLKLGNILFIDSDMNYINEVSRFKDLVKFEIFLATDIKSALYLLKKITPDIVIFNMMKDNNDTIRFLAHLKLGYKKLLSVIVGRADNQAVLAKIVEKGLCERFVVKPYNVETMLLKVGDFFSKDYSRIHTAVLDQITEIHELPVIRDTYFQIKSAVANDSSLKFLAKILSLDIVLTTAIIKEANDLIGERRTLRSIEHAVLILGYRKVGMIIDSFKNSFSDDDKFNLQLKNIAINSHTINRFFPVFFKMVYRTPLIQELILATLTYQIGKIIQLNYSTEQYYNIIDCMSQNSHLNYYDCELKLELGERNHLVAGAHFLKKLGFSTDFIEIARFHHIPDEAPDHISRFMNIIHFTDEFERFVSNHPDQKHIDYTKLMTKHEFSLIQLDKIGKKMIRYINATKVKLNVDGNVMR